LYQAFNTVENVVYTADLLRSQENVTEIVVMTSDYHMERAMKIFELVFRRRLPDVNIVAHPVPSGNTPEVQALEYAVEARMLPLVERDVEACLRWHGQETGK
jgi:uncharacterized SAM-binding protein YcdF (DUF218 family)